MKHQSTFELGFVSHDGPKYNENKQFPRTVADELAAFAELNAAIDGRWHDQARPGFEDQTEGIPTDAFMDKLELFPPTEGVWDSEIGKHH